jgi:[ribosomal protein S18]-alanine N-acetyltransferase
MSSAFSIQPMTDLHIDAALSIEQAGAPHPWTRGIFVDEIGQPETRVYRVALMDDVVVGFGGVLLQVDEAHITNVAVEGQYRRHGIARALMVELMAAAIERGALAATLEVRVANVGAQRLYHQFGFAPVGVRPKYYPDGEDAVIMWAHDIGFPVFGSRLDQPSRHEASA